MARQRSVKPWEAPGMPVNRSVPNASIRRPVEVVAVDVVDTMISLNDRIRSHDPVPKRGNLIRKFRWSRLRFDYGRYYVIMKPFAHCRTMKWWQWEDTENAIKNLGGSK